jgi:hypothetical protein
MTLKTVTKEIRHYSIPELAPDVFFEWIKTALVAVIGGPDGQKKLVAGASRRIFIILTGG